MEETYGAARSQLPELGAGELLVLTPWYPSPAQPSSGAFVQRTVEQLRRHFEITVLHTRMVRELPAEPLRLLPGEDGLAHFQLDVWAPAGITRQGAAQAVRDQLAKYARAALASAEVVHAHTGYPVGWASAALLAPTAHLVVTEHASYLPQIASWPATRRGYGHLLHRANALVAVSEHLGAAIARTWPQHTERIRIIANPVPVEAFHPRGTAPTKLRTWGTVSNLVASKRVDLALAAFAHWTEFSDDDAAQLRIIGDGDQRGVLEREAVRLGVSDRVHFLGGLSPDDTLAEVGQLDLLVHLSDSETFGLAPLEAVLSRVPAVVTKTAGSAEVLARAAVAGFAAFVPPGPQLSEVTGGVVGLEKTAARADWGALRDDLVARYGGQQVGERLAAVLRGETEDTGGLVLSGGAGRNLRSTSAGMRQLPRYSLAAARRLIRYAR